MASLQHLSQLIKELRDLTGTGAPNTPNNWPFQAPQYQYVRVPERLSSSPCLYLSFCFVFQDISSIIQCIESPNSTHNLLISNAQTHRRSGVRLQPPKPLGFSGLLHFRFHRHLFRSPLSWSYTLFLYGSIFFPISNIPTEPCS